MKVKELRIEGNDEGLFVIGVRIARRGYPGTPQAKTGVSIEPGRDDNDYLEIEYNGVRVH